MLPYNSTLIRDLFMWSMQIGLMLVMIAVNGLLAAFEIALASISASRLQQLSTAGRRGAKAALSMKGNMEGSLAVVQLGITLVGSIAGATAGVSAESALSPTFQALFGISAGAAEMLAVFLVVIPLTAVMIVFGELIPKVYALRNPEAVLLSMSPAVKWFSYAVWPLVWVLETAVKLLMGLLESTFKTRKQAAETEQLETELQELRASVAIARASRLIGIQQERIILGAAELSNRPISEIMLPAEFISLVDIDSSPGDALIVAHMDMHTRFPVTETHGDPQGIAGYVMFKDLVASLRFNPAEGSIRSIVRQISRYPDTLPIARALERLIHDRAHIALVQKAGGETVGMITMEDLIEELVGDIEDEYDKLPSQLVKTGQGWIVGGGLLLTTLSRQTGIPLPVTDADKEIRTVNDLISSSIQAPISGSEELKFDHMKIVVRKTRRHKVMEAYISKNV
ncbi:hemolysin family protein [Planctomicrobium sp. SH668]|uniref:hemolysin family protein n=1 Tax=Planctomicrobium sp. SH668 TaxID=3448126 RepID=UPI003F5B7370